MTTGKICGCAGFAGYPAYPTVMDINQIREILPHRYLHQILDQMHIVKSCHTCTWPSETFMYSCISSSMFKETCVDVELAITCTRYFGIYLVSDMLLPVIEVSRSV